MNQNQKNLDPHSEQPSFGLYQLKKKIYQSQRTIRNDNVTETKYQDHWKKNNYQTNYGKDEMKRHQKVMMDFVIRIRKLEGNFDIEKLVQAL